MADLEAEEAMDVWAKMEGGGPGAAPGDARDSESPATVPGGSPIPGASTEEKDVLKMVQRAIGPGLRHFLRTYGEVGKKYPPIHAAILARREELMTRDEKLVEVGGEQGRENCDELNMFFVGFKTHRKIIFKIRR